MAAPSQNTKANSQLSQPEVIPSSVVIKQPNLVVSMGSLVLNYLKDSWSNRRWELKLGQIEKNLKEREQDLKEQLENFDRNSIRLVQGKAALSDQIKALQKERAELQCVKDTVRIERQELLEQAIEAAKDAAKSECEVIRECATQKLQTIHTEIGQKQAELLALEKRLRNLREVFAGVAETVDMSLRECTQGSEHTPKAIYLVSSNNPEEVAVPLANEESKQVETAGWAPSLFATQKPEISSSELITSATCLRVG